MHTTNSEETISSETGLLLEGVKSNPRIVDPEEKHRHSEMMYSEVSGGEDRTIASFA